jgi:hypothetical protein
MVPLFAALGDCEVKMVNDVVTGFSPSLTGLKPGATSIHAVEVSAYTIPTAAPESDGTAEWGEHLRRRH